MLFQITSMWQILGWVLVFAGLVLINEFARRTKAGGYTVFVGILGALTVYFLVVIFAGKAGVSWAVNNGTYKYMNGWFHYAKLYAACAGCLGFMLLKYKKGIGAKEWFKPFPFIIVAINILIAVGSDFESAIKGAQALSSTGSAYWYSSEGVWLYGGWWNWVNGIAGIINIFCMTGWWGIYSSKDKNHADMLWPDMTIWFIVAYDIWNFTYTYLNLPTHSWYCGFALLLAPTFANALWNKGGWIQNRANTLGIWCMFAQAVPLFQISGVFSVLPVLYGDHYTDGMSLMNPNVIPDAAKWQAQGVMAMLALFANVICLAVIIKRSVAAKKNPYKNEIFVGTKDFEEAMSRAE